MKLCSIMRIWKKILYGFLTILLILIIWYFNLIVYGIRQGIGQMHIIRSAKSFEKFLEEGEYSDSLKAFYREKIKLIKEIKQFAIDSLGLKESSSYSKIYDQKGKPILWAVTACQPYKLEPKEWNYGPFGNMPYKGYFDSTLAKKLIKELKAEGLDVNVYNPSAWSTLGWFSDPVLSSMLEWDEGDLAGLIIHEMTHATIWIRGNVEYNENLADFVGDRGAMEFLASKYGKDSPQYKNHKGGDKDTEKFYDHILRGAEKLDSLYQTFNDQMPKKEKDTKKYTLIREIGKTTDTIFFVNKERYKNLFNKRLPNNAYFMAFRRYRAQQNVFEEEFKDKFKSNFKVYLEYLKEKY